MTVSCSLDLLSRGESGNGPPVSSARTGERAAAKAEARHAGSHKEESHLGGRSRTRPPTPATLSLLPQTFLDQTGTPPLLPDLPGPSRGDRHPSPGDESRICHQTRSPGSAYHRHGLSLLGHLHRALAHAHE